MAIESLPTFTKPARQRWEALLRTEINTARVQMVFINALDMPTPNHVSLRADCVDNSYAPDRTER